MVLFIILTKESGDSLKMLFMFNVSGILVFGSLIILYFFMCKKDILYNKRNIIVVALLGILLRILIAGFVKGYNVDISCFTAWSDAVFKYGPGKFYESVSFSDYPPGYIYVLYIVGFIKNLFGINSGGTVYNILLKLPAIICDALCCVVIYKFAKDKISESMSLFVAVLFIFCPMVYFNSAWWGQVDSVFTLIILMSLIGLYNKKYIYSAIFYGLALLVKPQAVIIFPVFIYYITELVVTEKGKGIKIALTAAACGALAFFVPIIPFSKNLNPFWIFDLYSKTLSSYPYASLNAPNLFGMLGANGKNIYDKFLFLNYNIVSYLFIGIICILSAFLYFKKKNKGNVFIIPAFLITGMYVLAAKMHERYIFPALALFLLYYVVTQKKTALIYYGIFSFCAYTASAMVLSLDLAGVNPWIKSNSPMFICLSFITIAAFVGFTAMLIKNKHSETTPIKHKERDIKMSSNHNYELLNLPLKPAGKRVKYTKIDAVILLIIVTVYSVIAFWGLGDNKAPETSFETKGGDVIVIDLGAPADISAFNVFNGRIPVSDNEKYKLEYSLDNYSYEEVLRFSTPSVFKWENISVNNRARYLRLSVKPTNEIGYLNEIAVYDTDEKLIPIFSVTDANKKDVVNLHDEQNAAAFRTSYKNGTYFDEIYHARTAYEHINGIEAYEWTHPPLGKLIIAIGVKTFGMNPFGWRFMGTLFGILMLPIMYALAKQIFKSTKFAAFATFLLAFDFMHFTQTRIATIDTYATFFIMLMFYFMYRFYETNYNKDGIKPALKYLLIAGLFFGMGAASKWTCIYAGAGLAAIFLIYMVGRYLEYRKMCNPKFKDDKKAQYIREMYYKNTVTVILCCVVYFVIIPGLIYWLSYLPYAFLESNKYTITGIFKIQENMYNYHSALKAEHYFSSMWYEWPIMKKPIWYFSGGIPEKSIVSSISAFGNPAIWWTSIVATIAMIGFSIKEFILLKSKPMNKAENSNYIMAAVFILVGYLAQYVPWIGVSRVVFIYHYFTSVPFIILIITYVAYYVYTHMQNDRQRKTFDIIMYSYIAVVLGLFIMFYPVISGFEVPKWYITKYLTWFNSWIFVSK